MRKTISMLAVLLVAQLALAVALGLRSPTLSARPGGEPVLEFGDGEISRIVLSGAEDEKVELVKTDAGWRIGSAEGFPADENKVEGLLRRLRELRLGMPVATSESARERFKVAEGEFERRIELAAGGSALPVLYLGTAPTLRQIHLRRGDETEIYSVEFASYDAPVSPGDWQDKTLLQFDADELTAIEVDGFALERVEEDGESAWRAADGTGLDPEAVDKLVEELADLRIAGVFTEPPEAEGPELALKVTLRDGAPREYRLRRLAGGDSEAYVLEHSARPEPLRLSFHVGKRLVEAAARDALTARAEPGEAPAEEATGDAAEGASD